VTVQALGHLLEEEQPAMVRQTIIYYPFYHDCNHLLLTRVILFSLTPLPRPFLITARKVTNKYHLHHHVLQTNSKNLRWQLFQQESFLKIW
jgi:hypothetical protein